MNKFYKCTICNGLPCVVAALEGETKPVRCHDICNNVANWKQTGEYEIVKKQAPPKSEEESIHQMNLQGVRVEPELSNQTPNCSICEWSRDNSYKQIFTNVERKNHICSAQADWEVSEVYDSENCKSLFSTKKTGATYDNSK